MPYATVVLNAWSVAYPTIINNIRADVSKQSDPNAIVASILDTAAGHPSRLWSFPGLPRTNYIFELSEVDGLGNKLRQLAYFDVVPGTLNTTITRQEEQIRVDTTPGLVSGTSSFIFDGRQISASSLAKNFDGNTATNAYAFTLKGSPIVGDKVDVDFSFNPNDVDPLEEHTVESIFQDGWTLTDLINDLYNKILAINANTSLYTDGDGFNGVKTRGFSIASGSTTVTASAGGGFVPDWRGWEISPEVYSGVGTLIKDVDYSWDKVTAEFQLLNAGDLLQSGQWYTVEFESQEQTAGGSTPPVVVGFQTRLITLTDDLVTGDFGNNVIIEPVGSYLEINLPDISTIADGVPVMIETGQDLLVPRCIKFVPYGTDKIAWLRGKIFMMMNESLEIYKFVRSTGVYEWRVKNPVGNYFTVGQSVSDDATNVVNKHLFDGSDMDINIYARLYNEFNLNLPFGQRIPYINWSTNKTQWSQVDGSGSVFKCPDRRSFFELNSYTGRTTSTQESAGIGTVDVNSDITCGNSFTGNGLPSFPGKGFNLDPRQIPTTFKLIGGAREAVVPKNYTINKYFLV